VQHNRDASVLLNVLQDPQSSGMIWMHCFVLLSAANFNKNNQSVRSSDSASLVSTEQENRSASSVLIGCHILIAGAWNSTHDSYRECELDHIIFPNLIHHFWSKLGRTCAQTSSTQYTNYSVQTINRVAQELKLIYYNSRRFNCRTVMELLLHYYEQRYCMAKECTSQDSFLISHL
jgi:hypothetical protein